MKKPLLLTLAAVPLLALGLAACSSDPAPVTVTSSPAPVTTSAAPSESAPASSAAPTESAPASTDATASTGATDSASASPSDSNGASTGASGAASGSAAAVPVGVTANPDTNPAAVTLANQIVDTKMTLVAAEKAIKDASFESRVIFINGEGQVATMDYRPDRFNLIIEGTPGSEVVVGITFG